MFAVIIALCSPPATWSWPSRDHQDGFGQPGAPSCARGGQIFPAYATHARGTECIGKARTLLDLTAPGRARPRRRPPPSPAGAPR